ncbi:hypothetical protein RND81_04G140500 [Saponaria officinalis]|uniref:Uncharacterized protein n=1 Tax=Saponaria officinalis TaxID=3572 RepID=A0AAW1LL11_SAPOF
MPAQTVKSGPSSVKGNSHRHIDREINDMISALTNRLTNLNQVHNHEDERGVGVITLAGTNTGATMRGEMLGRHEDREHDHEELSNDEIDGLDTYVNSNFQAVNNSIMFEASYSANDPGVHMEITDFVGARGHKRDKSGKKGSKKGKEVAHGHGNTHPEKSE